MYYPRFAVGAELRSAHYIYLKVTSRVTVCPGERLPRTTEVPLGSTRAVVPAGAACVTLAGKSSVRPSTPCGDVTVTCSRPPTTGDPSTIVCDRFIQKSPNASMSPTHIRGRACATSASSVGSLSATTSGWMSVVTTPWISASSSSTASNAAMCGSIGTQPSASASTIGNSTIRDSDVPPCSSIAVYGYAVITSPAAYEESNR